MKKVVLITYLLSVPCGHIFKAPKGELSHTLHVKYCKYMPGSHFTHLPSLLVSVRQNGRTFQFVIKALSFQDFLDDVKHFFQFFFEDLAKNIKFRVENCTSTNSSKEL